MKNNKFIVKLNILFKGVYSQEVIADSQEEANESLLEDAGQLSLNEFTEISADWSIAGTKRNFQQELSDIQDDVIADLYSELKRVGRDFDAEEEDEKGELEFFSYAVKDDLDIEIIKADGSVILGGVSDEDISMMSLIANSDISLFDTIGLLNDLRELPSLEA